MRLLAVYLIIFFFLVQVASAAVQVTASDTIRAQNTSQTPYQADLSSLYLTVPQNTTGTVRFTVEIQGDYDVVPGTAIAQVKKNGAYISTQATKGNVGFETKSWDITTQLNVTDTLQVDVWGTGTCDDYGEVPCRAQAQNFRLKYNTSNIYSPDFNITNGNLTVGFGASPFAFFVYRNNSTITANDYGDTGASWVIKNGTTTFNSTDYNIAWSNTSNTATATWNTSAFNLTHVFNISDNNTVMINSSIKAVGNQTITRFEMVAPLLADETERYDFVLLNNSMSATDRNMFYPPLPNGSTRTRYASYDDDIIVSSRDYKYFRINLSGNSSLIKSARQDISEPNQTNSSASRFEFGLINFSPYPTFESNITLSDGQTIWQNVTFKFNGENHSLPDNNKLVNESRFSDETIFDNASVANDARHYVENMYLGNLASNWYPSDLNGSRANNTLPYLWDSARGYESLLTSLSLYMAVQGVYFFGNQSGKDMLKVWYGATPLIGHEFAIKPWTRFEAETYLPLKTGWATDHWVGAYSGDYTVYATNYSALPLEMNFTGDAVRIGYTGLNINGKLNVSVDGTNYTLDLYQPNACCNLQQTLQIPVSNLTYNPGENPQSRTHNLKFYYTGFLNASSNGTQVDIDFVEVRRNDSEDQVWGYLNIASGGIYGGDNTSATCPYSTCQYYNDYFNETENITINGTTYPYNISLFPEGSAKRGAVSFEPEEDVLATYAIFKTDGDTAWLSAQLPRLEREMQWVNGMLYNSTYKLIKIPVWYGGHSYADAVAYSGLDSIDTTHYLTAADIMAQFYTDTGDTAKADYWMAIRDDIKGSLVKDITQGGLWYNDSVTGGGHFVLAVEPSAWIRFEAEEADFLNKTGWTWYAGNTNDYPTGSKVYISGRKNRAYSTTYNDSNDPYSSVTPANRVFLYTNSASAKPITWNFTGTGLRIGYNAGYNRGKMNISIDGVNTTLDQYNANLTNTMTLINSSLNLSTHNVKFYWTGTKNASSSDTIVTLDYVETYNTTLMAFSSFDLLPFTLGDSLLPSWYLNETMEFINGHEGNYSSGTSGLRTDYLYPWVPESYNTTNANFSNPWDYNNGTTFASELDTWGYVESVASDGGGYINGGHFPISLVYRVTNNYSRDMQPFVNFETGKYGLREWYYDNESAGALPGQSNIYPSAEMETQWGPYYAGGFVPFWGTGYISATPTHFNQSVYNTGWEPIFINSTMNMSQIGTIMNSSNVQFIDTWNATSQKWETYKAGWSYRTSQNVDAGQAVYIKFTNNDTVARNNSDASYNWTVKTGYNLLGLDYNGSRNLSQINTSINTGGNCQVNNITYVRLDNHTEYTFTCSTGGNDSVNVEQGEGFWVYGSENFSRARSW